MKASETNLRSILEGNKQFIVPLFQRTYSWDTKEWETLWNDLQDLYEEEHPRNHFIGSTVTIPVDSPASGVAKFLLIDGQQRLTTILIVLALLRDQAKSNPESTLAEEITDSFLANRYKKGSDYWKLLPTQADREPFAAIMYEQTTVRGRFLTHRLPSQRWASTRLGERIRSGRSACWAARATMMVAV